MKTTFKQLFKGLWGNMKIAAKDRVDLIMFLFAAILSYLDIKGKGITGSVGFVTFYTFFVLIRLASYKQRT